MQTSRGGSPSGFFIPRVFFFLRRGAPRHLIPLQGRDHVLHGERGVPGSLYEIHGPNAGERDPCSPGPGQSVQTGAGWGRETVYGRSAGQGTGRVSGAGEVVKVAARVGGGTLGAAIGTAVLGPVGGFVGYALGDWVTKKIVGASYSERQIEQEEKIAKKLEEKRQEEAANPSTSGGIDYSTVSPEAMMQLQQILYGGNGNIFEQDFYSNPFATMSQQNTTIAQETQNK